MNIVGGIVAYAAVIVEAIFLGKKLCDPGTETYIYIGLSCLFGLFAFGGVSDSKGFFSALGRTIVSLIAVPMAVIVPMFIVEVFMWLVKTFTLQGVFGIGIIVAIIIAILGSTIFIIFF
jgi:hypothetical protein